MGYVFEPEVLHEIACRNLGPPMEELLPKLVADLADRYPNHINTDLDWVFNNAGGAMGAMTFLHGSITEYLIIFGTPIGTEGHTGRFFADDYFIILEGEQVVVHARRSEALGLSPRRDAPPSGRRRPRLPNP